MKHCKIAIPVQNQKLADHFGRCSLFLIYEVNEGEITHEVSLKAPDHDTGVLPEFLRNQEVNVVLAAGIGQKALDTLAGFGIEVVDGIRKNDPGVIVRGYLAGQLEQGLNLCDH